MKLFLKTLLYIYVVLFVIAMMIGAGYLLVGALTVFTEGFEAATSSLLIGITTLIVSYLVTVFVLFLFTKQWSWIIFRTRDPQ